MLFVIIPLLIVIIHCISTYKTTSERIGGILYHGIPTLALSLILGFILMGSVIGLLVPKTEFDSHTVSKTLYPMNAANANSTKDQYYLKIDPSTSTTYVKYTVLENNEYIENDAALNMSNIKPFIETKEHPEPYVEIYISDRFKHKLWYLIALPCDINHNRTTFYIPEDGIETYMKNY